MPYNIWRTAVWGLRQPLIDYGDQIESAKPALIEDFGETAQYLVKEKAERDAAKEQKEKGKSGASRA